MKMKDLLQYNNFPPIIAYNMLWTSGIEWSSEISGLNETDFKRYGGTINECRMLGELKKIVVQYNKDHPGTRKPAAPPAEPAPAPARPWPSIMKPQKTCDFCGVLSEDHCGEIRLTTSGMQAIQTHAATEDDIFADIGSVVERLPDADKARLTAQIADTRRRFNSIYVPRQAYGVVWAFVKEIRAAIPPADTESIAAADFLATFCDKMLGILCSIDANQSLEQRIAAQLKEYYIDAPLSLKLAMLKRLAQ